MLRTRVIPCLLIKNGGLVKTVKFDQPQYVGDPINAVRIFNDKQVDELILLDIVASKVNREPNYDLLLDIVSEAFMPIAFGGGVKTLDQAKKIINLGVEKIIVNTAALINQELVVEMASSLGSQSVVGSIDIKKDWRGKYQIFDSSCSKSTSIDLMKHINNLVDAGVGEIFINSVDRDGTGIGYDLELIEKVSTSINVPVIASGGASNLTHFKTAATAGASAVAAGSMFVFVGKHRAVMINYPQHQELEELFHDS